VSRLSQRGDAVDVLIGLFGVGSVLLLIASIGFAIWYPLATHRQETMTVTKMERINAGKTSKYLVFTKSGVYENTDSLLNWKFNSSDLYNDLLVGMTYDCDVYGWRVRFLSWYPNIVDCQSRERALETAARSAI
jgi:hypothetical protein